MDVSDYIEDRKKEIDNLIYEAGVDPDSQVFEKIHKIIERIDNDLYEAYY